MEKEELYKILDIEEGSDFTFFENLADLFETDEEYSSDLINELLDEIDLDVFGELCTVFFDQMQEALPDDETDFYTLVENIKKVFAGMADACSSEEDDDDYDELLLELAGFVVRFHEWFIEEGLVACTNNETGETSRLSVRDACFEARAAKFTEDSLSFDFSDAMEFELSEYSMSFADLTGGNYE